MSIVIADLGSSYSKIGNLEDNEPVIMEPSIVGRPRRRYVTMYPDGSTFCGLECVANRSHLSVVHPIDHGYTDDWEDYEELFNYLIIANHQYHNPGVPVSMDDLDSLQLLLMTPPNISNKHLQSIAEVAYEGWNGSQLCLATGGTLALLGHGTDTGMAIEIGDGVTQVVPIANGFNVKSAIKRVDIGGSEVTQYFAKLICDRGYNLVKRDEIELLRRIKESHCYLSENFAKESVKKLKVKYQLPDGMVVNGSNVMELSNELFYAPEVIFDPSLLLRDEAGLTDVIWQSLREVAIEDRRPLLKSMYLSGGGSMLQGLQERLQFELENTCPPTALSDVNVKAPCDRTTAAWRGGNMIANHRGDNTEGKIWVAKQEWDEKGVRSLIDRQF